jgi:prepilin-type N-terminal cleavage/methylation domain-containing protein/prepilin-type processing-associated H-X9-DG protein
MTMKKAFTLIELLVVIAIIAILAAILFPVFAQAKDAAKKTQTLSNLKQQATAVMIYQSDADDVFPGAIGRRAEWGGATWCDTWQLSTQPYTKNTDMYRSPVDTGRLSPSDWRGIATSYAANASVSWVGSGPVLQGPMGYHNAGDFWFFPSQSSTAVTQPAGTILFCERHHDSINSAAKKENQDFVNSTVYSAPIVGVDWVDGWLGYGMKPDGARLNPTSGPFANTAFPKGRDGAVVAKHSGKSIVAYCDGHAKVTTPVQTNPNGTTNPELDQWNGLR